MNSSNVRELLSFEDFCVKYCTTTSPEVLEELHRIHPTVNFKDEIEKALRSEYDLYLAGKFPYIGQ